MTAVSPLLQGVCWISWRQKKGANWISPNSLISLLRSVNSWWEKDPRAVITQWNSCKSEVSQSKDFLEENSSSWCVFLGILLILLVHVHIRSVLRATLWQHSAGLEIWSLGGFRGWLDLFWSDFIYFAFLPCWAGKILFFFLPKKEKKLNKETSNAGTAVLPFWWWGIKDVLILKSGNIAL